MGTPDVFEVADAMVMEQCDIDPITATMVGVDGFDDRWPDLGGEGMERQLAFARDRFALLERHRDHPDPVHRHAAAVICARLAEEIRRIESGDVLYDLSQMGCSFESIRSVFDLMDTETDEQREAICRRLESVDQVFDSYEERLRIAIDRNRLVAARQVQAVLAQVDALAGGTSAFDQLPGRWSGDQVRVRDGIRRAKARVGEFGRFLRESYAPAANDDDRTDPDRYARYADRAVGKEVDVDEGYRWGWDEVGALITEMTQLADEIKPGADLAEVVTLLETDIARAAPNASAFVSFVEARQRQALAQLDGSHFAVPPQAREVAVKLAPPGNPPGAYYFAPSEDFSRPGSIWYSIVDHDVPVPLYQEVSTAYHEGFPGHHLQLATTLANAERLTRFHRLFVWYSGFGEGWALYAERLMDELGYFEKPEYRFGMLANNLFRSTRVVVDLGIHHGLSIPPDAPLHPGERWSFDIAVDYMHRIGLQAPHYAKSEVLRYLGWPAQAISYKLGERCLLDLRESHGGDLRSFHDRLLAYGEVRLDHLVELMEEPA